MLDNPMNEPITRRELKMLAEILRNSNSDTYICEVEFMRQAKISRGTFYNLKKLGKLNSGTHPATLACRKRRLHKRYDFRSGRILDCIEPAVPKPDRKKEKKKAATQKKETGL
ncbi:MAG: hypothetical protein LBC85_03690 [Fibromonadaceae bacterium]|jgi:hypothetical protein|nr:hypothetical protein [Fibromonadaceae bacterium]